MKDWELQLAEFDPVALKELDGVKLLDRMDTKFVFRLEQLADVFRQMLPHYRALEIGGVRASRYETLYFDTDDFDLYTKHHSGKLNRHKLRYRRYVDSGLCFFEIKVKTNKGRTVKTRTQRKEIERYIQGSAEELLHVATPFNAGELKPKLWVLYTRCTFAGRASQERLTIDLDLRFAIGESQANFPKVVIAELKQDKSAADTPFTRIMRAKRIREGGMSKYCFGVMHLYPEVKQNLFKENARYIEELAT